MEKSRQSVLTQQHASWKLKSVVCLREVIQWEHAA
jgi:hypothetical protein